MDALDKEAKIKPKFPLGFLILYFVLCASGITLLELLGRFIISKGAKDFLNALAGTAGMVVAFIVLGFVLLWFANCLITPSNKLNKNKNFRCRGLFIMMKIISILSPILFIATIFVLKWLGIKCIFFNYACLFLEFCVPVLIHVIYVICLDHCPKCGLTNTLNIENVSVENLGVHNQFHTEDSDYWKGIKNVVCDGLHETKRTSLHYKCSNCGYIKTEVKTKSNKI